MDNVVQNIKLEDIIPRKLQNTDPKKIEELVSSIQQYGVIEPILVRPQNGKYEIILGNKRYQASRLLGLKTIPALIKNMDDEMFHQYLMINEKQSSSTTVNENKFINFNPNQKSQEQKKEKTVSIEAKNSKKMVQKEPKEILENQQFKINYNQKQSKDIVNLSELNKEEYERDDFNMNNEQMNNNVMNNLGTVPGTMTNSMQEPTFGGRFFPSLEDEPTNMNMGGLDLNTISPPSNQPANNLIDLTDLGIEKELPAQSAPSLPNLESVTTQPNFPQNVPEINAQPAGIMSGNIQQSSQEANPAPRRNVIIIPDNAPIPPQVPELDNNIINIGNLQNSNPAVEATPIGMENQIGVGLQNSIPAMEQPQPIPQFDMSQNIAPTDFGQQQGINPMPTMNMPQNDFNGMQLNNIPNNQSNELMMNQPQPTPMVEQNMYQPMQEPNIPTYNQNVESQVESIPMNNNMPPIGKDTTPIINTLTNLARNLEAFGYKINISEEELPTSVKITIEVEK